MGQGSGARWHSRGSSSFRAKFLAQSPPCPGSHHSGTCPTPRAHQRDRLSVTNELRGWGRGRAEPGWGKRGAAGARLCRGAAAGKGGARGRGAQGRAIRRPSQKGRRARGGRAPPPAAARSGSAAAVRACTRARPPGMPQSRAEGAGQRHRGDKRSPSPPAARTVRPSIPRARGEMLPVPPPRPAAADPPRARSPASCPEPSGCSRPGSVRGARCLPAGAVRGCPLPAGLPALSGAARRAVGAALPQSGQGWAGGPSEWGPGGVTEARPPALRRGAVRGGPCLCGTRTPPPRPRGAH